MQPRSCVMGGPRSLSEACNSHGKFSAPTWIALTRMSLKTTLPVGCLVALEPSREPFGSAGERRKSRRQLSIVVGNNGTCIIEADAQFVTQRVDSAAWLVAPTPRKASR